MKELLYVYAGVWAHLVTSNFHTIVSNLLAITTIIYTLAKLYQMYQNYKNGNNY